MKKSKRNLTVTMAVVAAAISSAACAYKEAPETVYGPPGSFNFSKPDPANIQDVYGPPVEFERIPANGTPITENNRESAEEKDEAASEAAETAAEEAGKISETEIVQDVYGPPVGVWDDEADPETKPSKSKNNPAAEENYSKDSGSDGESEASGMAPVVCVYGPPEYFESIAAEQKAVEDRDAAAEQNAGAGRRGEKP